jgi:hypothetical protein
MVIMKRFNFTREQAIEHLDQVAQDEEELAKIRAKYGVALPDETRPLDKETEQVKEQINTNEDN